MLRRCMRGAGARGVDEEPAIMAPSIDIDPLVRRLSLLAGEQGGCVVAPSLVGVGAVGTTAAPSPAPPSFLVNRDAALTPPAARDPSSLSFSSTPMLVRLTSSMQLATPPTTLQPQASSDAALASAGPPLPAERRLVWTQSKSRREAWLLEEAKQSAAAMSGLDERLEWRDAAEENEQGQEQQEAEEGVFVDEEEEEKEEEEGKDGDDDGAHHGGPFGAPEDRRRLRKRLARLGLARQRCEGDGNCLFRAVSAQLYGGSQGSHAGVRAAAVAHMRRRADDYSAFLGEDFEAYLAGMSVPGTWGDELVLRAVSDALCVVVHVVTSDSGGWYHLYRPSASSSSSSSSAEAAPPPPEIFLAYLAPVHYEGLMPAPQKQQQEQQLSTAAEAAEAATATAPLQPRPTSAMCSAEA